MDPNNEQRLCDHLIEYITDQLNEMDQLRYERHLDSCASCRQEVFELQEVWESMPYTTDMVDPPTDLKDKVMSEIFSQPQRAFKPFPKHHTSRSSYWFYSICTAMIISIIIGTIWNYQLTEERQLADQSQMAQIDQPSVIEKLFPLSTETDTISNKAFGVACIVKQGDYSELVVYVLNAKKNQGDEAYQVWLLHNSERMNAGTFQIGDNGVGVLTYQMKQEANFDAIGITLEPDSKGNTPRGRKIFGNSEQIIWN
jgi:hypothetical protein